MAVTEAQVDEALGTPPAVARRDLLRPVLKGLVTGKPDAGPVSHDITALWRGTQEELRRKRSYPATTLHLPEGDWFEATSVTGGQGALTLTGLSGSTDYLNVFGGGDVWTAYEIEEFAGTDYTTAPLLYERGIGVVNLSTGILYRTRPLETYNGSTLDQTDPDPISFGTTTGRVLISGGPEEVRPKAGFYRHAAMADVGRASPGYTRNSETKALVNGTSQYLLWDFRAAGKITKASIYVTTAVAASHVSFSLYAVGADGWAGRLLYDFGAQDTATTGFKTVSPTGLFIWEGVAWVRLLADAAVSIAGATAAGMVTQGVNSSGGGHTTYTLSETYSGTAPTTGAANSGAAYTGTPPMCFFKVEPVR